jgi:hypothetical protein
MAKEQQTGKDEEGSTRDLVVPEGLRKRRKTSDSKSVSGPITDSRNSGSADSTATFKENVLMLASYETLTSEIKFLHSSYVSAQLQRRHADN